MAIDAEDVLVCLWTFLRFFINTTLVVAQRFPFVSFFLLLSFFVYFFFNLLLHHLPFLIFLALLLRLFWSSETQLESGTSTGGIRKDGEKPESGRAGRAPHVVGGAASAPSLRSRELSSLIRQKSRRTHFGKNPNFAAEALARREENDTKLVVVHEERETLISFEHPGDGKAHRGSEVAKPDCVTDDDEDGEEEEEYQHEKKNVKHEKNKAVEWTKDDQQNVVDLGFSEIERNRRLESLMARRRARKLPKLPRHNTPLAKATACSAAAGHVAPLVAPIFVASGFSDGKIDGVCTELELPGSAPSVLLPVKNPFDIPYDPTEERPILTGDSFQAEFAPVNKETMTFCRHESFLLGPLHDFDSDIGHNWRDKIGIRMQPDTDKVIVSETLKLEGDSENCAIIPGQDGPNDVENLSNTDAASTVTEADIIEDHSLTTSSSASYEPTPDDTIHATIEPRYDSSPRASKSIGMEDGAFFRDSMSSHTPSCSIASDMQVEVSEIGTPPTVGNVSPNDGDSLSFDQEMEKSHLLNFGVEPFECTGQAGDGMSRVSNASTGESREVTPKEKFASHPFFEAVYERIEALSPREKNADEYAVDEAALDSATDSDSLDDTNHHENHVDGEEISSEEAMENFAIPSPETEFISDSQFEHQSPNREACEESFVEERIVEVSEDKPIEASKDEQNSAESEASIVEQDSSVKKETLVEEVTVNLSSPSSPVSTPIQPSGMDGVLSSQLDENQITSLNADCDTSQANGEGLMMESSNLESNTGDSKALEEPVVSEKISGEINIAVNINEAVAEDKADTNELFSNSSAVAEAETTADIENALEILTEGQGNMRNEASEDGNLPQTA